MSKWKLTLREPTEEMAEAWARLAVKRITERSRSKAADDAAPGIVEGAKENYRAMLAASPDPAEDAELVFQIAQVLPHDPVYCAYTHGDGAFGCSCHAIDDARAVLRLLSGKTP